MHDAVFILKLILKNVRIPINIFKLVFKAYKIVFKYYNTNFYVHFTSANTYSTNVSQRVNGVLLCTSEPDFDSFAPEGLPAHKNITFAYLVL